MHRAYSYRLAPTVKQTQALSRLFVLQCEIYNSALEERKMTYDWQRRGVSSVAPPTRIDQYKILTGLSALRPEFAPYGITVCRGTLKRLDEAFQGFFRRVKAGQQPGYPRFCSSKRFDSLSWPDATGWKLDEPARRLYLQGVGHVKANLHRPLRGVAKTITVRRRGRHLEVTVFCSEVPKHELPPTGRSVGIDLGVGVLAATSDGVLHRNPRHRKQLADRLAASQRERSRHRRGSYRYKQASGKLARLKEKEANRRKDALHKLSRALVEANDLIVHERLKVANLSRSARGTIENPGVNVKAKSTLNDAIVDSGWARLIAMITYKAAGAGRTVVAVNPAYTSQRCSSCDHVAKQSRHEQRFNCVACGFTEHADVNAARNILRAGLAQGGSESERQADKSSSRVRAA
jgi:putative transposase